jgi:DNA-binding CsgD family transcriptional regulator
VIAETELSARALGHRAGRWTREATAIAGLALPVPAAASALASRRAGLPAIALPRGRVSRFRLRTRAGRWAVLRASRLPTAETEAVAVIIEEPSPAEIAPVLMMVYGLTTQEQAVTAWSAASSRRASSQTTCRSLRTRSRTLKSIFDKTGVSSRRELVAVILQEHYLPRALAGKPLSAVGILQLM